MVLSGNRVVELGMYIFVPVATAVVAEWGADVIKIEHPQGGDPLRTLVFYGVDPASVGVAPLSEMVNRGKRSVGIDVGHRLARARS